MKGPYQQPVGPGEAVGAALYFASEASSVCTGSVLELDGDGG